MSTVTIYSSNYCPFCTRAKQLLSSKNAAFKEINVDGANKIRQEMTQKSGRTSVPQIWIGEQHIGGCDDLFDLEKSKKLDALLAKQ